MPKIFRVFAACFVMSAVFAASVSAESANLPYHSYTHYELAGGGKKSVYMRDMYIPAAEVTARSLGLEEAFDEITDIDCDREGNTYVLTADGKITVFDNALRFVRTIAVTDGSAELDISGAAGINARTEDMLFIADTRNSRVLSCRSDGVLIKAITAPESSLVPEDFVFSPTKVDLDSKGYLYVLSEGAYYGALLFSPDGEFNGFYGANTTNKSPLTTLAYIWDKLTGNDIKRAKSVRTLPYQFVDFCIDKRDFVYTCTGQTVEGGTTGQIRMLSPGGTNILYRETWNGERISADSFNFGETDTFRRNNKYVEQNFLGIDADDNGFIYALDQTYGLIYIYDSACNLLSAFGGGRGLGQETGVFQKPVAIALSGTDILVADTMKKSITVFKRTAYGELVLEAQRLTLAADYAEAEPLWTEVLSQDQNSRFALRGLAKAALLRQDYAAATSYARRGYDAVTYSQALQKQQNNMISENFGWIALGSVCLVAALALAVIMKARRRAVIIQNPRIRIFLFGAIHPFQSFNDLKYKKLTSVPLAVGALLAFYITSVMSVTLSNFRFTSFDASSYNSLFQMVQTIGLVLVWSVVSWAISILQEGKGYLKEVFTVSSYATLPLTLYNLASTALSHVIASPDSMVISQIHIIALIFAGIILTIGLMIVHDFSFPKFLFITFLTVCAILLVIFMIFMLGMLISEFAAFLIGLFFETYGRQF